MATKSKVTATSNLNSDESGAPLPVPVPAQNGQTVDEQTSRPKRRMSVAQKVQKVGKLAATILADRGKEARIQLQIAASLLTAEPLFVGDDGKPGTLPIPATGLQGESIVSDLTFYEWTDTVCRLNYQSTRQYLQAARMAEQHPDAATKVESIKGLAVLEGAANRKPEAVAAILADLAPGATIAAVETAVQAHAPKPVKPVKVQDTSKIQTALELAARDQVWKLLSLTTGGMDAAVIIALQDYAQSIAVLAADPNVGKGSAVFSLALGQLHREWNEQRESGATQRRKRTR